MHAKPGSTCRTVPAMSTPHGSPDATAAERRWADALAALAIPDAILEAAPTPPHGFDVGMFSRAADDAHTHDTPSQRVAREVLPEGGSVLDVGCGGGAGAMPLTPRAGMIVGVDEGADMLEAFTERAQARGVRHIEIQGRWPDVAARVPPVDVVVCHNVLYNVPDIGAFVRALVAHARIRVVVEITETHPLAWMTPYWQHLHGLDRPEGPVADDAIAVVRALGFDVQVERWERSGRPDRTDEEVIAQLRHRLGLTPDRDAEIAALLERYPPPETRPTVTLWWSPPPR